MSHYDRFLDMLRCSLYSKFKILDEERMHNLRTRFIPGAYKGVEVRNSAVVRDKEDRDIFGYRYFYSEWLFDLEGNLLAVGHWE